MTSDDRRILVNYEEDGHDDEVLDNGFGDNSFRIPPSAFSNEEPVLGTISQRKAQPDPPSDRFNYSYFVFYLLGSATMVPWNFFITAEDYWMYKFRNTTYNGTIEPDLTPLQRSFTPDLTMTASVAGTTCLILNAIYGHYISLKLKMIGTLVIIVIFFCLTAGLVEVNTDSWQEQFFTLTMITVIILNISSALMSGGLFGIAGLFPSEYMTAAVSGQALGGIFTALAFITALTFGASPSTTAFVYFSIGIAIVIISIILYVVMSTTKFFKFHVHEKSNMVPAVFDSNSAIRGVQMVPDIRQVFRKIYLYAVCLCLVFMVTLSVYPSVTVLVKSENFGMGHIWNDIYFLPVVNYLIFNSGDYLGRIFAGLFEVPKNNPQLVLLLTVIRCGFIPLFMTANIVPHFFLPTLIHTDITFILLMVVFSISNGYLANICLIMVPRIVMQHEKEMASAIMAASLSVGLALGSCTSMMLVQMV